MRKLGSEDEGLILMITFKAADFHKRSELLGLLGKKNRSATLERKSSETGE